MFYMLVILVSLNSCNGQKENENNTTDNSLETIKPKTNVKVNKVYDDNGNLIRYDSIYTYYYSNVEDDSLMNDSIFSSFKRSFNQSFDFSDDPFFKEFFMQDSLPGADFYTHDFFEQSFQNNMMQMQKLFMEMDSVKNRFFYDYSQQHRNP